jgi:transposase
MQIAATRPIQRTGNTYTVPALKGNRIYLVDTEKELPKCNCSVNRLHQDLCEHIFAVGYYQDREKAASQPTPVDSIDNPPPKKKKTYPQDWPAYNEARMHEKDRFQVLLAELCERVEDDKPTGVGRPRLNLRDMIFSTVFKTYTGLDGRTFTCDLKEAQRRGHIGHAPHYNSIFNLLETPKLTPLLLALIERSAWPLRSIEVDFAVDSSGFETSCDGRYFEHVHGKKKERRTFMKCHLICGVRTNIVAAVKITDSGTSDTVLLPGLVKTAAEVFDIEEVSADKGYLSHENVEAIVQVGGMPFILPKINSVGGGSDSWGRMFHYFQLHEPEFLDHYHKRSNVESTFHMIKAKFGHSLSSRSDRGMINEALCKVLCHNLVVLNHEMIELHIDPSNWGSHPIGVKAPTGEPTVSLVPMCQLTPLAPPVPEPLPVPDTPTEGGGLIRRGIRGIARLILKAAG